MNNCGFLRVEPAEIQFQFELGKQISCSIQLSNSSADHVAFKIKTTDQKKYCVRPNMGVLKPNSSCNFTVSMRAQKETPLNLECNDKFLVQSTVVSPGVSPQDFTTETFKKETEKQIDECRLKVVYVMPPVQPPQVRMFREMSTSGFLEIEPAELRFPFELEKQSSCRVQLRNKSDNHVGFQLWTMIESQKKYTGSPNNGVVAPNSTFDFKVNLLAQKEAPPNLQCDDILFVLCAVVSPGVEPKDFTLETFKLEGGKQVDYYKFKVTYIVPTKIQPPPPQAEAKTKNLQVFCNLQLSCFCCNKKVV